MAIQELFVCQIVADVILCIFILFISMRLGRNIRQAAAPVFSEKALAELRKLIQESRDEAERFSHAVDDSCRTFRELAIKLEDKETRLVGLIQEVKGRVEKFEQDAAPPYPPVEATDPKAKYRQIIKAFKAGTAIKDIAQSSGLPEGEVALVIGLENIREEPAANGSCFLA